MEEGGEKSMNITLKQARRLREMTQQEMADLMQVGKSTYLKLEKNPSLCTVAQAKRACEILGFDVGQIFFEQNISK
jgi:DNA-binding XRE family transcriptional regulator